MQNVYLKKNADVASSLFPNKHVKDHFTPALHETLWAARNHGLIFQTGQRIVLNLIDTICTSSTNASQPALSSVNSQCKVTQPFPKYYFSTDLESRNQNIMLAELKVRFQIFPLVYWGIPRLPVDCLWQEVTALLLPTDPHGFQGTPKFCNVFLFF